MLTKKIGGLTPKKNIKFKKTIPTVPANVNARRVAKKQTKRKMA